MIQQLTSNDHRDIVRGIFVAVAVLAAVVSVGLAPMEETMGDAQRVLYIHVSVAWLGLIGFPVMAAAGAAYLLRRDLAWDHWSEATGEIGWLCSTLTLITGSLWAHAAWDVWWTWEPRLLTSFILWALYSGSLFIRSGIAEPHRRARISAVIAILGVLDVPLVVLATRWFRGMHPPAPSMEMAMRATLMVCVLSFTALFTMLLSQRRRQIAAEHAVSELEMQADQMCGMKRPTVKCFN